MASETKVRLVAPSVERGASEGFTARLAGVTLADLIQMKCMSGATESVRVSSAGKVGMLQFLKGNLSHAATANLLGDNAVLELLRWRTGDCEPFAAPLPAGSLVRRAWQSLLLSAAQETDEMRAAPEGVRARETSALLDVGDTPTPVRSRAISVRMSRDGQVLDSVGPAEDLAAATAYALHMAMYIGESLGLETFRGAEFRAGDLRTVMAMEPDGNVVASQSPVDANVAEARARAGL